MIGYLDWKERSDATAQKAEQVRQFALIDTRVKAALQKKIDDAKKAEADAKARAEADAEAQKATAVAHPAGTTSSTAACDVSDPTEHHRCAQQKTLFQSNRLGTKRSYLGRWILSQK
jgi:membrane protein involved in colicin uptake